MCVVLHLKNEKVIKLVTELRKKGVNISEFVEELFKGV